MGHRVLYRSKTEQNFIKLGLLYNWPAATDPRNIFSAGFRLPTILDTEILRAFIDPAGTSSNNFAAAHLKETGTVYWNSEYPGTDNSMKFNARGGGRRDIDFVGGWKNLFSEADFWCSNSVSATYARTFYCQGSNSILYTSSYVLKKLCGASIRGIKITTELTHGQEGVYVGNNGIEYRTICIGSQEWIADNLAETKFQNGEIIQEIQDETTWNLTSTPALCAYNNDWNNV